METEYLATLETIQRRVIWLSTLMIHHANHLRPNPDGAKIGGHQASSASIAAILTALYFHYLRPGDHVAVKPQAAPAFHALQYLLGQLPRDYLTQLRAFQGLQAYPSRTKDPDHVDFSTGSVGLGAVAPIFAGHAHRYAKAHFGTVNSNRFVAIVGDGELDEGSVWEAILDEALGGLNNLLLIVDLNRQSLDRVVPGIRAERLKRLFEDNGWQVLEVKYGRKLIALFERPYGRLLHQRIDSMSNEEYQALIRLPGDQLRPRLMQVAGLKSHEIEEIVQGVSDEDLPGLLANLAGHDMSELVSILDKVDQSPPRPTILFAYTIKGWGLPFAGHPLNHSMLVPSDKVDNVRDALGVKEGTDWDLFPPDSPEGKLCTQVAERLYSSPLPAPALVDPTSIPQEVDILTDGLTSTQDTFGRLLVRLAELPALKGRIVTASPDVAFSTNLSGWINKVGVFTPQEEPDYETEMYRLLQWKRSPAGQHIELGISEMNLFMLLGMLGLSAELCGQQLLPIGTVYDPFVCRGLDALIYALYSGAKFIFVGTPSGVSLAPEGGAHQSTITPSLGLELPLLNAYEPTFAKELGWILLEALRECCDREQGHSTYLRLSTKVIDQALLNPALQRLGPETLRKQVLAGGYRLLDWKADAVEGSLLPHQPLVQLAATGVMIPEVVAAAHTLQKEGVAVNVLNLVSPRRLFEHWQANRSTAQALAWLLPPSERHAPIITVQDGASHTLAWLGSIYGATVFPLGVDTFGQSGTRDDLYQHYGIRTEAIVEAAFAALDLSS